MKGSPPRVRGKVQLFQSIKRCDRITPACAGKRRDGRRLKYPGLGSPPRVRGKVAYGNLRSALWRITPACAGKRLSMRVQIDGTGDHPRVCGEKYPPGYLPPPTLGSPPRVRGKGGAPDGFFHTLRITPACAGKRNVPQSMAALRQDHPRVCGEKYYPKGVSNGL